MEFKKPCHLVEGDNVAVLSPSWGGPSAFPAIFEVGVSQLTRLGLRVREYPTTRMSANELYENPKLRAEDLSAAFADSDIKAIFTSIGGDDCVRLLPHMDWGVIQSHPKTLMGYSDTTALLAAFNVQGLVTFHGPAVMAGIAQLDAHPGWAAHVAEMLFRPSNEYVYQAFDTWSDGYPDWADNESLGEVLPKQPTRGWQWLQGEGTATGTLFGGCIEVLEFLKGTEYWPAANFWNDKILFFETSEEIPTVAQVKRALRNYGLQGAFDRASALLFGRAMGYTDQEKKDLERALVEVVAVEFGAPSLTIVANMDFGHTDPQHILPLGVEARLDCASKTFRLVEPALRPR